jgi:hypothetical protein
VEKRRWRSGTSHSEPKIEIYGLKNAGWVYTELSGRIHIWKSRFRAENLQLRTQNVIFRESQSLNPGYLRRAILKGVSPMQTKSIGLLVGVLLLPLACFGQLTVSESGVWSASAPTTTWSAPGASWSYSFVVAANPTVLSSVPGQHFVAPFSNFTYTLNGSPVATTPGTIAWFSTAQGGLITINSAGAQFNIYGPQAYSGPESSPTILTGTYPLSTPMSVFTSTGNAAQPLSGAVTIAAHPATVPALSGWGMIALALTLLAVGGWRLRGGLVA